MVNTETKEITNTEDVIDLRDGVVLEVRIPVWQRNLLISLTAETVCACASILVRRITEQC